MPTRSNHPPTAATSESMVWLWERVPDSLELQKVRVPAKAVPSDWLEPLQRRYHQGDRVRFTWTERDLSGTGTVVQDQGLYIALDGDQPGTAYTLHKTDVEPLDPDHAGDPATPSPPRLAVSPREAPDVRVQQHRITARWNLGEPIDGQWQPQASLRIDYGQGSGFTATLHSVDEFEHRGLHRERHRPNDPIVVHHHPAPRFSQKALHQSLRTALATVRDAFDRSEPAILAHFTTNDPRP